jgi:large subunit ribosomal protein L22
MAQARAILRNHPTSPRKMRYVVDAIRGVDVEKALDILRFSTKHSSTAVERLVVSAINNWKQANDGARAEDAGLFVKEVFVDAGTTIKRFMPAPHGRAYKKKKRSNHVTLVVDSRTGISETKADTDTTAEATVDNGGDEATAKPKPTAAKKAATKKPAAKKTSKKTTKA